MLCDLPQELLLAILSNLGVEDIFKLSCLCKSWDNFINENQYTVFRAAAILEFNAPPWVKVPQDLQSLYSSRVLSGVSTWKEFCARVIQIKKSWGGKAQSTITSHQYAGDSGVHRFKVDEQAGLIIATTPRGGLYVTDLNASKWYHGRVHNPTQKSTTNVNSALLWALTDEHVRAYAHCEYDHGYLIFDRYGGQTKEVWRLTEYDKYYSSQSSGDDTCSSSPTVIADARPDDEQRHASETWQNPSDAVYNSEEQRSSTRGKFIPWALLHTPLSTMAFRFIYPTLLVASLTTAYLYDVRSGGMVQEIVNLQGAEPSYSVSLTDNILGNISYGDHSPEYIFICRGWSISVFSRLTGQCVYAISATFGNYARLQWKIGGHRNKRSKSLRCIHGDVDDELLKAWDDAGSALYQHVVVKDKGRPKPLADRIIATRVSSCGKFLALLFETSRILIIRDLERLFKGEVSLHDCSVQVQLGRASRFSRYLAFEHGRIGVAARNGIFIIIPHPSFFSCTPLSSSFPPPSVLRVHALNYPHALATIGCLQMTQTGLFVDWFLQCPLTCRSTTYPENRRKQIHSEQEDIFWKGLKEPLTPIREWHGNAYIAEDGIMMADLGDCAVLSVDFVPT